MSVVALYDTDIAGVQIHGLCPRTGIKDRHAALPFDPVPPFVSVWMPMHLADGTWFDGLDRRCDRLRDIERAAVSDAHITAGIAAMLNFERFEGGEKLVQGRWKFTDPRASCIMNGVDDRGARTTYAEFADTFTG